MKIGRLLIGCSLLSLFIITGSGFAAVTDPVGDLNVPRYRHSLHLMADEGKILVFSGRDTTGSLIDAEIYDPATGLFTLDEYTILSSFD